MSDHSAIDPNASGGDGPKNISVMPGGTNLLFHAAKVINTCSGVSNARS
ncbi:MAG: hypothetical protein ABJH63_20430 [Rhizobiaceae bacterium]